MDPLGYTYIYIRIYICVAVSLERWPNSCNSAVHQTVHRDWCSHRDCIGCLLRWFYLLKSCPCIQGIHFNQQKKWLPILSWWQVNPSCKAMPWPNNSHKYFQHSWVSQWRFCRTDKVQIHVMYPCVFFSFTYVEVSGCQRQRWFYIGRDEYKCICMVV